jgi:hypothetical protein
VARAIKAMLALLLTNTVGEEKNRQSTISLLHLPKKTWNFVNGYLHSLALVAVIRVLVVFV